MIRLIAAILLVPLLAVAAPISGPARIIDGDTLDVAGQRIRLHGIDAPEKSQLCRTNSVPWACGVAAWGELVQLTAGRGITCEPRDTDRYGRVVAVCFVEDRDINEAIVRDGWGLAYRQFSTDYVDDEGQARAEQKGIWNGEFVPPWDWRRGERLSPPATKQPAPRRR
jgi:endonuclease YncB( thermonuclease family)